MKVKKEISLAIFIGLFIALLVTGGIMRAQRALKSLDLPSIRDTLLPNPTPKITNPTTLFLEITSPDNSVTKVASLTLTGKTLQGTYIAILGEKSEYLIIPNELGSFSQEVTLVKGANNIKITVYEQNGNKIEKTVNAVYTTAEI
ncbi:MAG: hypothetical protein UX37_C0027G0009 [Microgenomates group bacterium GW2011_GWA2_46_16]|nr:MAG: hypothetical protein UX37_C0027G0009 [Microgenomates group bacterium GW2011_GWA2_46_16]